MRGQWRWVFGAYLTLLAVGVLGPAPREPVRRVERSLQVIKELTTVPTLSKTLEPATPPPTAVTTLPPKPHWYDDWSAEEVLNVALFIPLGVLLPLLWPRIRWWTVPIGIAVSCAIELIQGAFLSWRSQSLVDVETNSLGAMVGFALFLVVLAAGYSGNMPRRGSSV